MVLELSVKGFSQREIANKLQISEPTISNDIDYLRQQANENIKYHIEKKLPLEYKKCLLGLEQIIKECYLISENANTKDKLQSLSLISEVYSKKMDLLTNASLLQDSIKFVEHNKVNCGTSSPNKSYSKDKDNDLQGSTEDNITEYNNVF